MKPESTIEPRTTLTKKELRQYLGIKPRTLSWWLNEVYYEKLKKIGYKKKMRIIPCQVVQFFRPEWSYENSLSILRTMYANNRLQNESFTDDKNANN